MNLLHNMKPIPNEVEPKGSASFRSPAPEILDAIPPGQSTSGRPFHISMPYTIGEMRRMYAAATPDSRHRFDEASTAVVHELIAIIKEQWGRGGNDAEDSQHAAPAIKNYIAEVSLQGRNLTVLEADYLMQYHAEVLKERERVRAHAWLHSSVKPATSPKKVTRKSR